MKRWQSVCVSAKCSKTGRQREGRELNSERLLTWAHKNKTSDPFNFPFPDCLMPAGYFTVFIQHILVWRGKIYLDFSIFSSNNIICVSSVQWGGMWLGAAVANPALFLYLCFIWKLICLFYPTFSLFPTLKAFILLSLSQEDLRTEFVDALECKNCLFLWGNW